MSIILKGFRAGAEPMVKFMKNISDCKTSFDGYLLDSLDLNTTLTTQEDFDDLITLLKYHQHCFLAKRPAPPTKFMKP